MQGFAESPINKSAKVITGAGAVRRLDIDLLGDMQGVVNLDPEISDSAL
jgi:hypothetical protein